MAQKINKAKPGEANVWGLAAREMMALIEHGATRGRCPADISLMQKIAGGCGHA
ncbi:MAG: hypothetical protein ACD_5C00213G0005 [uncultured bacterium]|nr:MAG: hypothetical protein ACD_5C00213G0005 [uncultured bacterium]